MTYKKFIFAIKISIPFLLLLLIFLFSQQSAAVSGKVSNTVSDILISIFPVIKNVDNYYLLVRKLAHITEFSLLFVSFFILFKKTPEKALLSFGITLFAALVDEAHQLFVTGRCCSLTDVIIDISLSAIILIVYQCFFYSKNMINEFSKKDICYLEN